jgi:hypothetical protein
VYALSSVAPLGSSLAAADPPARAVVEKLSRQAPQRRPR